MLGLESGDAWAPWLNFCDFNFQSSPSPLPDLHGRQPKEASRQGSPFLAKGLVAVLKLFQRLPLENWPNEMRHVSSTTPLVGVD